MDTSIVSKILNRSKIISCSLLFAYSVSVSYCLAQNPEAIVQLLLYNLRSDKDAIQEIDFLANISANNLHKHLDKEANRKAFWINAYNAFILLKIKEYPELFKNKRNSFFTRKWIFIAQQKLSFDDIEHGILRRSKHKYSRGALDKPNYKISKFERKFRLDSLDNRVHFALNCGAMSCPPVVFYESQNINAQLEDAKSNFIQNESTYFESSNVLCVSKIFSWFIRDFGGKQGVIEMHKTLNILPSSCRPLLRFKDYNWDTIY